MPALKWLCMLMNHIPDKYEHLVRYYGHYSNRSRGTRRLVESADEPAGPDPPVPEGETLPPWRSLLTCENSGNTLYDQRE